MALGGNQTTSVAHRGGSATPNGQKEKEIYIYIYIRGFWP
jgi:hypothetical protein